MDKDLLKYNVAELALSINEATTNIKMAVEQLNNNNQDGADHYKGQCIYWSKRAVEAVYCLGLDPEQICPKQHDWATRLVKS